MQNKKRFFGLFARGLGMGAADVVPGVSGGTIAFITGIYEELLETISNVNFKLITVWRKEGFKAMWTALNGNFLLAVLLGVGVAIVSLAKGLEYLLVHHPIPLWSFFFGLILASVWLVGKTVDKWNVQNIIGCLFGAIAAYYITILTPTSGSDSLLYVFFSGALAICAMILPGISGSFILVLLGSYLSILGSISGLLDAFSAGNWSEVTTNGTTILIFILGCIFGLLAFSKLLNYLFKHVKSLIIAVLTGFLLGSLNKVWPWKIDLEYIIDRHGELQPTVQENVLPDTFTTIKGEPNHLMLSILCLLAGLGIVLLTEYLGSKLKSQK